MSWRRLDLRYRAGWTSLALVLFIAGSNFCLLSVLSGGSMSCLTAPSATGAERPSHCSHAPSPTEGEDRPVPPSTSSCCVTVAPVQSLQVHKADTAAPEVAVIETEISPEPVRSTHRFGYPPEQKPPPLCAYASRHLGRAPPLS